MKILINIIMTISDYKIKAKTDEALIKTLIKTFSKIFNKNHVTFNNYSDEIKIDQNLVFSSVNTIIAEKTIFVLNMIFQIIQLEVINFLLILIKHL